MPIAPFLVLLVILILVILVGGSWSVFLCVYVCVLRFYLFNFRERGREGEGKGEKHCCGGLPLPSSTRDEAATLTRNPTSDLLLWGTMSNQLKYTSQGSMVSVLHFPDYSGGWATFLKLFLGYLVLQIVSLLAPWRVFFVTHVQEFFFYTFWYSALCWLNVLQIYFHTL